jgi:hypothetical protein
LIPGTATFVGLGTEAPRLMVISRLDSDLVNLIAYKPISIRTRGASLLAYVSKKIDEYLSQSNGIAINHIKPSFLIRLLDQENHLNTICLKFAFEHLQGSPNSRFNIDLYLETIRSFSPNVTTYNNSTTPNNIREPLCLHDTLNEVKNQQRPGSRNFCKLTGVTWTMVEFSFDNVNTSSMIRF